VYVTSIKNGTVSVISGMTKTVTATIPVGSGPVGVAVNPLTGAVYTANIGDDTVSVISG
jgi:YVTN family beta-propeller protein